MPAYKAYELNSTWGTAGGPLPQGGSMQAASLRCHEATLSTNDGAGMQCTHADRMTDAWQAGHGALTKPVRRQSSYKRAAVCSPSPRWWGPMGVASQTSSMPCFSCLDAVQNRSGACFHPQLRDCCVVHTFNRAS
eukprot:1161635-Pelagomonas_calceolata.AAC.6